MIIETVPQMSVVVIVLPNTVCPKLPVWWDAACTVHNIYHAQWLLTYHQAIRQDVKLSG